MELLDSLHIAAAGMKAQSDRLKVVSENLANANSVAAAPGGKPYQRKLVVFRNMLDRELGLDTVRVHRQALDQTEFNRKFDPGHPAADEQRYVLYPNVNPIVEMMDMKEAQRAYEANLNTVEISKSMLMRTIELLR